MEKSKKSIFPGFMAVSLVLLAFLVSWFWIVPQYKQSQASAAQADHDLTAVKDKLESLKTAQATLAGLGSTVDSMFVAVPKDTDTGNIITTLEAIATANKSYIPSFQITGGTAGTATATSDATAPAAKSTNTVSVSFSVSGGFAELSAFVKAVESNLKFFNVNSMTLATDSKGVMSMTMELTAYTQNNTASLSTAATATAAAQ